ncbi:acyl-CoA dehydrogenase [Pseudomonas sp. M30-35]|uniref:acyl-CoA dehydrogenase n=1 Tax=Pseudomonas sp. M30-35 TaxID=1981174 RepID=UPI000B3C94C8|nr:acyl-CoA dehydrogenase [Pseudomonas sp. M30-35]ARU89630.1 acyl-CoA dehydrogenase [Pseudomonas sp. M30-35]
MLWDKLLQPHQHMPAGLALDEWYSALLERLANPSAFELAVLGGNLAPTPGMAFLAGYQGALRALWPSAPWTLGALCVTERKSVRPADMQTRLSQLQLSGTKDFVTAGDAAQWLLVAAREEAEGEPPQVAVTVVESGSTGVLVEPLPALKFIPDVSHARLTLEDAKCERLPGDGLADYVKPFRSIEDLHVLAAVSAWLFGVGQNSAWPTALQLRLLGLLSGCAEVSKMKANASTTHVFLGGLFAQFAALSSELDSAFAAGEPHWKVLWQRDKALMSIANSARTTRLQRAQAQFSMPVE